jgi:hypothetical protein
MNSDGHSSIAREYPTKGHRIKASDRTPVLAEFFERL